MLFQEILFSFFVSLPFCLSAAHHRYTPEHATLSVGQTRAHVEVPRALR